MGKVYRARWHLAISSDGVIVPQSKVQRCVRFALAGDTARFAVCKNRLGQRAYRALHDIDEFVRAEELDHLFYVPIKRAIRSHRRHS